ncbi:MAG: hypothetical protein JXR73_13070 [Candidatus Omnitrophica bacterium]|nr:hypothetical protein [Candidatus Omnitrophota bacterium]
MRSEFKRRSIRNLLLFLPATVLIGVAGAIEYSIVQQTGRTVYPIDDPYIHLAMARHFAEHGVFGVSLAGFSASSSSPLWTLLLGALFRVLGNHEFIPFLLNLIFGFIVTVYLTRLLADRLGSILAAIAGSVFVAAIAPLPTHIALGMEHILHIGLTLMLVERASRTIGGEEKEHPGVVLLLVFLAMLTRLETMFVAAPLALLCMMERKWKTAAVLIAGCGLPLLVLGWINVRNDWFFFPMSVVLKSPLSLSGWERIGNCVERLYGQLFATPHMAAPFGLGIAALLSGWRHEKILSANSAWGVVFAAAMTLHCAFASIGWFYRYEGYLLIMGAVAAAPSVRRWAAGFRRRWKELSRWRERILVGGCWAGLLLLLPFPFYKQWQSIGTLAPAARNIYSQQYQMGLFLKNYYEGEAIAANDIGAINYLADIECLDPMGLGSMEPVRAKLQSVWSPRFLHSWCMQHKTAAVMIYESWFKGVLPTTWIKAGEWRVDEKISVADSTVSFFALTPYDARRLRKNLIEFEANLPKHASLKLENP